MVRRLNRLTAPSISTPLQSLVEEQQSQLNQYECAAGQCVSELQKAQLQVQSLQAKIQESEANNMVRRTEMAHAAIEASLPAQLTICSDFLPQKLQEKLSEMECELRSLRQASQSQERTIQDLTETISTKDSEVCVCAL